ncbi:MAG TPA: acyltransferase [Candidatus Acidoferrales bacterium]|nr:acyltransferase [Candidatus Acidoferrales bacterium]
MSLISVENLNPHDISLREDVASHRPEANARKSVDAAASVRLDMVRGIAAIVVMIGHVRALFFPAYVDLVAPTVGSRVLYAMTGFGHQAVIIFFVLSGYFIGASVLRMVKSDRWSWRVYSVHRAVRLWIVLVPALMIGAAFDWIGMKTQNAASTYFVPVRFLSNIAFATRFTTQNFFGNLFYLQAIRTDMFGSNGPLWSLSYEFWYYVLFPLSLFALAARVRSPIRVLFALAACGVLWFVGSPIALDYLIWFAGVGVFLLSGQWSGFAPSKQRIVQALSWATFIGSLAWIRVSKGTQESVGDFVLAAAFSVWMIANLPARAKIGPVYESLARSLAGFSYTLYLTHFPLLALLRATLNPAGSWPTDVRHWTLAGALAIGCLAFAFLIASFTEAKTATVRTFVLSRLTP